MAALQTVAFGAASDGSQGDSVRTGFTKDNANVAVLQTQAALTTYTGGTITAAQALTKAHVGQRVNINLATAGTVNVPVASTCGADNVLFLRNLGTTVVTLAITSGSGDTLALSKLNAGETALLDTDGVHTWSVLMRGRTNSDNETVNGNCAVNGNETIAGTLAVTGAITATGGFSARPAFAGNTPWDSGNLAAPMNLDGAQTITGLKQYNQRVFINKSPVDATWTNAALSIQAGSGTVASIGLGSNIGTSVVQLRATLSTNTLEVVNANSASYQGITCYSLTQTSDARLKTDVETIPDAMGKLRNLRGVYYTMQGARSVGVIAQEVQAAFPELVQKLGMDYEDGTPLLGVQYQNMVGALLQGLLETDTALQSALARIAALEAKDSA